MDADNNGRSQDTIFHVLAAKDDRHELFAKFVASTIADKQKRVIDVAGGKGKLSHALVNENLRTVLVDPCAGTGRAIDQDGFFGQGKALSQQEQAAGPSSGGGGSGGGGGAAATVVRQQTLDGVLASEPELFLQCSAIVGLHPDEATEGIVDAALRYKVPFAVVPCCVLEHLFDRKRKSGRRVKKLGAFIEYLREKDWRIQTAELDFAGRNEVLFMSLQDYELPEEMPMCGISSAAAPGGEDEREEEEEEEEVGERRANKGEEGALVGASTGSQRGSRGGDASSYQAETGWSHVLSGPVPPELAHLSKARLKKELRFRARQARKSDPIWKEQRKAAVPHKQQKAAFGEKERSQNAARRAAAGARVFG